MRATEMIDLLLMEKTASTRWAREFISASDKALKSVPNSMEQQEAAGTANRIFGKMKANNYGGWNIDPEKMYLHKSQGGAGKGTVWQNNGIYRLLGKKYAPASDKDLIHSMQHTKQRNQIQRRLSGGNPARQTERSSGDLNTILDSYKK